MVSNVDKAVNDHHLRRFEAMKTKDIIEKRLNIDYAAKGYKVEGFKERRTNLNLSI
jgi:hypothetical protein